MTFSQAIAILLLVQTLTPVWAARGSGPEPTPMDNYNPESSGLGDEDDASFELHAKLEAEKLEQAELRSQREYSQVELERIDEMLAAKKVNIAQLEKEVMDHE